MTIKYKKKLGQNFLIDKNILKKIIDLSTINTSDYIVEIGPGSGNLTNEILSKNPKKIIVIEKDKSLIPILANKFIDKLEILNLDILKIDEKKLFKSKCKVFGNLPYNISTKILSKWILNLDKEPWFDEMYLMFQKEVAERIVSETNKKSYGRLSILSQWRLDCEIMFNIKPASFYPIPKVESALIKFTPKTNFLKIKNTKNLEKVTSLFFNQRRKKIKNVIKSLFGNEIIENKIKVDLNLRPQNLSPDIYYNIVELIENN